MKSKNILLIIAAIIVIGTAGTAYYFYHQYQQAQQQLKNPTQAAQQETQAVIDKVSKLIALPSADLKNGEPTLATVLDKSKLKDQPFFQNAENGDKVLIYTKAKKAFLYRPSTNKVINVAPVTIGSGQQVNVAILNGTTTSNLAGTVSDELKKDYPNVNIVSTDNAKKTNYTQTIVVDLNNNPDAAKNLAQSINATVAPLPDGETKPAGADFLVIVGSDKK